MRLSINAHLMCCVYSSYINEITGSYISVAPTHHAKIRFIIKLIMINYIGYLCGTLINTLNCIEPLTIMHVSYPTRSWFVFSGKILLYGTAQAQCHTQSHKQFYSISQKSLIKGCGNCFARESSKQLLHPLISLFLWSWAKMLAISLASATLFLGGTVVVNFSGF